MSDRQLAELCVHGRYEAHHVVAMGKQPQPCPGGRDITIDYEAAAKEWLRQREAGGDGRPDLTVLAAVEGSDE